MSGVYLELLSFREGIENKMLLSENDVTGTPYNKIIGERDAIVADVYRKPGGSNVSRGYIRAGPRQKLHFNPRKVNAAIVTCGGLCPGLNNVIREITNALFHLYNVKKVIGIQGGYKGFCKLDPTLQCIIDFYMIK